MNDSYTSTMQTLTAFNLQGWIDRHREYLRPPVGNRQIFHESEFIIMVVGGPNARTDYHDDPGDEFFYQLEGEMVLKTMQNGQRIDMFMRAGEILLLPRHVPHSPQRFADGVGLVIERVRKPEEKDGFLWYCDRCNAQLYAEYEHVSDIVKQLPPIFERFYQSLEARTCKHCGHVTSPAQ
jgi:3-hydroxyanthranilate 3,4-dioxygenase